MCIPPFQFLFLTCCLKWTIEKSAESAAVPLPPRPPGFFKTNSGGSGGQAQSPLRAQPGSAQVSSSGQYGQTSRSSSAVRAQRSLPALPPSAAGRPPPSNVQERPTTSSFKDKSDEPLIPPVQSTFFHNRGMRTLQLLIM